MSGQVFQTPIEYLKGVGTARADILKKELAIANFEALLNYISEQQHIFSGDTQVYPYGIIHTRAAQYCIEHLGHFIGRKHELEERR